MGAIVRFTCSSCSFDSGRVMVGPSPNPERFDPVLVACKACEVLTVLHQPDVAAGCPVHGTPLTLMKGKANPPCPRCGARLVQVAEGLWD